MLDKNVLSIFVTGLSQHQGLMNVPHWFHQCFLNMRWGNLRLYTHSNIYFLHYSI